MENTSVIPGFESVPHSTRVGLLRAAAAAPSPRLPPRFHPSSFPPGSPVHRGSAAPLGRLKGRAMRLFVDAAYPPEEAPPSPRPHAGVRGGRERKGAIVTLWDSSVAGAACLPGVAAEG